MAVAVERKAELDRDLQSFTSTQASLAFALGLVRLLRYVTVGDCGGMLRPMRAEEFLHEDHTWEGYVRAHFRGSDGDIFGIISASYRPGGEEG